MSFDFTVFLSFMQQHLRHLCAQAESGQVFQTGQLVHEEGALFLCLLALLLPVENNNPFLLMNWTSLMKTNSITAV